MPVEATLVGTGTGLTPVEAGPGAAARPGRGGRGDTADLDQAALGPMMGEMMEQAGRKLKNAVTGAPG